MFLEYHLHKLTQYLHLNIVDINTEANPCTVHCLLCETWFGIQTEKEEPCLFFLEYKRRQCKFSPLHHVELGSGVASYHSAGSNILAPPLRPAVSRELQVMRLAEHGYIT